MYEIIYIGDSDKHFKEVVGEYEKRLKKQLKLYNIRPKKGNTAIVKKKETQKILQRIQSNNFFTILLDETGKEYTSIDFESYIHSKLHEYPRICFIIGGAHGVELDVLNSYVDTKIRLSKMTLPHGLALCVLLEQVYRAVMIQKGTKYHHE